MDLIKIESEIDPLASNLEDTKPEDVKPPLLKGNFSKECVEDTKIEPWKLRHDLVSCTTFEENTVESNTSSEVKYELEDGLWSINTMKEEPEHNDLAKTPMQHYFQHIRTQTSNIPETQDDYQRMQWEKTNNDCSYNVRNSQNFALNLKKTITGYSSSENLKCRKKVAVTSFSCSVCCFRFQTKCILKIHEKNHRINKCYKCSICEKKFPKWCDLKVHQAAHSGKKYHISTTRLKPQQNVKKKHELKVHQAACSGKNNYVSNEKNMIDGPRHHVNNKNEVKQDQAVHNVKKNHIFSKRNMFEAYQHDDNKKCESSFTNEKPSDSCGSSFTLDHQLLSSQLKPKDKKCHVCNKIFAKSNYLPVHMLTHTGEKPFKCHICKSFFSRRGNLRTHILEHSVQLPLKCRFCDKAFTDTGELVGHLPVHNNHVFK